MWWHALALLGIVLMLGTAALAAFAPNVEGRSYRLDPTEWTVAPLKHPALQLAGRVGVIVFSLTLAAVLTCILMATW